MATDVRESASGMDAGPHRPGASPLEALADAARAVADGAPLGAALGRIAEAAAGAARADLVVVRVRDDENGCSRVRAVSTRSRALAAELECAALPAAGGPDGELDETDELPAALRDLAARIGAGAVLQLPVVVAGRAVGTLELLRRRRPFDAQERLLARLAATQAAVALDALDGGRPARAANGRVLELAGEALAAATDDRRPEEEIARVAVDATGARASIVWRVADDGGPTAVASSGDDRRLPAEDLLLREATGVLKSPEAVVIERLDDAVVATVALGRPAASALQLVFDPHSAPDDELRAGLGTFAVRAAHALRASARARSLAGELERTRTLLAVVAQANADLSLAHTLETVIDRVAGLLGVDRVAIYLRENGGLVSAAERALEGPHATVAERLLEIALGPLRARGMVLVSDARRDPRLAGVRDEVEATSIESAVGAPLLVPDGVTGLLAVYPPLGRAPTDDERALLNALAAQLAVAVQNARLHEQATALGAELEQVLTLERQAARQLRSLYEISRSFAQTLSLEATLEAVARTVVELLGVEAAAIHMRDARGEVLVPRAVHVADPRLASAVGALVERPHPMVRLPEDFDKSRRPLVLDAPTADGLGSGYELLLPFLAKGSTAVVLPIATPAPELLGTLTVLSLDPDRPITEETSELALSVAGQAALAIDNARLYQQQKEFSDAMQRALLPRSRPSLTGLDLGAVYESSARVDVGGDVYDFMTLPDGRLAVVLGDVTGHGIDAAAEMAMAKFVFRSLAREHPEPGDFLASANDVVCGEIASGKFITMAYLTVDGRTGALAAAAAGHPRPRLIHAGGRVERLEVGGLALGIVVDQEYEEQQAELPRGATAVLFTDGVIEARRNGELFGDDQLDEVLAEHAHLPASEIANAVLRACRAWSGDLEDDCAVVAIRRTAG